jgi:hypothetical protein
MMASLSGQGSNTCLHSSESSLPRKGGVSGSADIASHQRQLDKEISNDISRLNNLLPDDEADKRDTWVKLLLFHGESQGWRRLFKRSSDPVRHTTTITNDNNAIELKALIMRGGTL